MILEFRHELEALINKHSMESGSDTPDFILCEYLMESLAAFDRAVNAREKWYGRKTDADAPDCDHPFRVTGDVCLNCGEPDASAADDIDTA